MAAAVGLEPDLLASTGGEDYALLAAMVAVLYGTRIDFTWHTFIGSTVTILAGNASWWIRKRVLAHG